MTEQQNYKEELLNYIYDCANTFNFSNAKIRKLIIEHKNINLGSYNIKKFKSKFNYEKSIIHIENTEHLISDIFGKYKLIQKGIVCKICIDLLKIKVEDLMLYYSFNYSQVKSRENRINNKLRNNKKFLNIYNNFTKNIS
tara:strand:- start:59 stop:478 length:420 start_codon:yes stop_codon:yes gene_type:complete